LGQKTKGRLVYFGKVADDPKGKSALCTWLEQRDDLLAGCTPRAATDGLTICDFCNRFPTAKQSKP
jgi:hypothetical protein